MKKSMLFFLLLTVCFQATASENYNKMRDVIRQYMSKKQGVPHDLTEYGATLIFSRDDVYGVPEEILQLSNAGIKLFSSLTLEEKAKLPSILLAMPGYNYAMKFCTYKGHCKIITSEQPTVKDLDRSCNDRDNYVEGIIYRLGNDSDEN